MILFFAAVVIIIGSTLGYHSGRSRTATRLEASEWEIRAPDGRVARGRRVRIG